MLKDTIAVYSENYTEYIDTSLTKIFNMLLLLKQVVYIITIYSSKCRVIFIMMSQQFLY
jgi:hypothetical protein